VILVNVGDRQLTEREQQLSEHEAFRHRLLGIYEGGQTYMNFLNDLLQEGKYSLFIERNKEK
jgi:hypothetical protein